jgi:hypothetical protein
MLVRIFSIGVLIWNYLYDQIQYYITRATTALHRFSFFSGRIWGDFLLGDN